MSEQITVTLNIWAYPTPYRCAPSDPEFSFVAVKEGVTPYYQGAFIVKTEEFTISFELPKDTTTPQIDALTREREEIKIEAHKKVREINDRIQKINALPQPE